MAHQELPHDPSAKPALSQLGYAACYRGSAPCRIWASSSPSSPCRLACDPEDLADTPQRHRGRLIRSPCPGFLLGIVRDDVEQFDARICAAFLSRVQDEALQFHPRPRVQQGARGRRRSRSPRACHVKDALVNLSRQRASCHFPALIHVGHRLNLPRARHFPGVRQARVGARPGCRSRRRDPCGRPPDIRPHGHAARQRYRLPPLL